MSEIRGVNCLEKYQVTLFVNGVEIIHPYTHKGYVGETVTFSVVTNMPNPTYAWSLDQPYPYHPAQSTESIYQYTFDGTDHTVHCLVTIDECSIQKMFRVKSLGIYECPVVCKSETVMLPPGKPKYLVSEDGTKNWIGGSSSLKCAAQSRDNLQTAENIADAIRGAANCASTSVSVSCQYNFTSPNCITLTITNSPIKFRYIIMDSGTFTFNTQNC